MEKINWSKAIGYGALLWVILFALVWLLSSLGIYEASLAKILVVLAAAALSYGFARKLGVSRVYEALGYGVIFAATGIVLDLLVSAQVANGVFSSWEYWVGYALIVLAPLVNTERKVYRRTVVRHT